ncbi:MAG: sulfotransferase, partial [Gammaproteobacteria bacterium]
MNPRLAAMLARYAVEPSARREVRGLRLQSLSLSERLEVAGRLLEQGDARAAALWLFAARRENPDDATVVYRLANALRSAGRERAAAGLLERLIEAHPAWTEPAQSLAWLHRRARRADAAGAVLERWAAAVNYSPKAVRATAAFLQEMGLDERAEVLYARAPGVSEDPKLLLERGNLLLRLGRFDEAERVLRDATRLAPGDAGACFRLAYVRRWRDAAASPLDLLETALEQFERDSAERAALYFAIAKINDDLGCYAEAFAAAERANALRARSAQFDRAAWSDYERALRETFTPEFFSKQDPDSLEQPVFVVGMPRSGTTLVERRLARHPALMGAGELELIEMLGRELAAGVAYPRGLAGITREGRAWVARQWRTRLPTAFPPEARIVDKNPLNFLHLGFIATVFPRARIVHCRRDPLDTALSIYFQNFAHPRNDYAYRVEDIAWMLAFYRRTMRYWERVLPLPVHTVDYER